MFWPSSRLLPPRFQVSLLLLPPTLLTPGDSSIKLAAGGKYVLLCCIAELVLLASTIPSRMAFRWGSTILHERMNVQQLWQLPLVDFSRPW